jgi:phosphatidylserine/phosphatidylglycerophosphate/cardiolipin synthase-like enzyme
VAYQPIVRARSGDLRATALVGAHSVVFGFDLDGGLARHAGLLGFAIRRTNLASGESEWLKNPLKFKRAPHTGQFNIAGTPSNLAPLQQFHWNDHQLDNAPGVSYRYAISALYGDPADPQPRQPPALLDILPAPNASPAAGALSLFFNRGVVASPAYRRQFDNQRPGKAGADEQTLAQARSYLSRGLWEALLGFVDDAAPGDELCVAIYELHHESVVDALQRAVDRGVRLRLLYHARSADERTVRENRHFAELLRPSPDAALPPPEIRPRRRVPRISHNKFVLRRRAGGGSEVWTGSTNFSEAGFFLQTNVGLILREPALAAAYAAYFELLWGDPPANVLRPQLAALALPAGLFFSPVAGDALLQTAATLIREARDAVLISCPFGLEADGAILRAIKELDPRVVVCGLLNTNQRGNLDVLDGDPRDMREFAVPDWLRRLNGAEYDTTVNSGNQIHVKSLVVDPWGQRPRLLLGSANFSGESVNDNDENALLIEGDGWAAAVVATEFLRAFEHYRFRNQIRAVADAVDTQGQPQERSVGGWASGVLRPADAPQEAPAGGLEAWFLDARVLDEAESAVLGAVEHGDLWLAEDDSWAAPYFAAGHPRERERGLFMGG